MERQFQAVGERVARGNTLKRPKILVVDIETNGINGFKADLAYVLCIGYKWYGRSGTKCPTLADYSTFKARPYDDKELIYAFHAVLKTADIVAGHYLRYFDWPFLQSRFAKHGLSRITHLRVLDTWEVAKANFKLSSNRLDNLAAFFGCGNAKMSKGRDWSLWWRRAAAGDVRAVRFIQRYCKQDVATTDELLTILRPYWPRSLVGRVIASNAKPFPTYLKARRAIASALLARVRSRINVGTKTDCWTWLGSTGSHGYGDFRSGDKHHLAHRFMYELFVADIPRGTHVDHLCCNRQCVNPMHLEPVTPTENIRRGFQRGAHEKRIARLRGKSFLPMCEFKRGHRRTVGILNGHAKITPAIVRRMRSKKYTQSTDSALGAQFGLSAAQARRVRRGESWRSVGVM